MIKKYDFLEVGYEGNIVGRLAMSPDQLAAFEYDPEFLKTGFSISPFYLPPKAGVFLTSTLGHPIDFSRNFH